MPDSILYQRLLGGEWHQLDAAVQRMHTPGRGMHAAGVFRVLHGRHRVSRLLARLLRFPAEAERADVQLRVEPSGQGEVWRRTFERRPMVTRQCAAGLGILKENLGLLELHFELTVENGGLTYRQLAAGLRFGSRFVPIPGWIRPTVAASEQGDKQSHSVATSVTVTLPRIGLLLSYAGQIEALENEA